ncbi:hypothetical protein ACFQ5D_23470 [Paenibacillus farraposensis]|uniref:Uncharacterized protein n=1 Tax=Paenibacillus farraposensis TaxID=2807095 RepID=A0ABW4DMP6_9BACL|nr:hypothetical protein [Paenibacillus farraposensis]MCC3380614.1 hypothetical protein [Paenibacillus farraposensis]
MPYIQVDNDAIVCVISDSQVVPDADNIYAVESYDTSLLGKRRLADGTFEDVPHPEPPQELAAE